MRTEREFLASCKTLAKPASPIIACALAELVQLLHANTNQHLSGSVLNSQRSRDEIFCRASELEPHDSAALQLNCSASSSKRRSISGIEPCPR